jgi:putative ABC transport system ATP-binding protein
VAGREVVGLPEAARRAWRLRHLGFVFQDHPLVEHLTAEENVLLPYLIGGLRLDGQARTRGRGLLEELGLADKLRRLPQRLSQGERQRVGLARALVTLPDLLLADEPTSGLDPARARQVVDLLLATSAARGVTLLVVSHDLAVVERLDARVDVSAWAPTGPERVSGRE